MKPNHNQYVAYIRETLRELSAERYPNNPRLQMLYQIGFMQSMLAEVMWNDSKWQELFRARIQLQYDRDREL